MAHKKEFSLKETENLKGEKGRGGTHFLVKGETRRKSRCTSSFARKKKDRSSGRGKKVGTQGGRICPFFLEPKRKEGGKRGKQRNQTR